MQKAQKIAVRGLDLPAWPIQQLGAVAVKGDPSARGKDVFTTDDGALAGGVWECSPGVFDLTFTWDEMALLLEGALVIQQSGGPTLRLHRGDFFFVPRGTRTRWTVTRAIKKVYFSREARA